VRRAALRALPLLLLPFLLSGCQSMKGIGKALGELLEYVIYIACIALPFVLAYYLNKD
jgi:predicted small secreted protein